VYQICFRPGLRPDPTGGAYGAPPDPLAGLRGPTSKGKRRKRGKEDKKGRKMEREEQPPPPFANSWIRPCTGSERVNERVYS